MLQMFLPMRWRRSWRKKRAWSRVIWNLNLILKCENTSAIFIVLFVFCRREQFEKSGHRSSSSAQAKRQYCGRQTKEWEGKFEPRLQHYIFFAADIFFIMSTMCDRLWVLTTTNGHSHVQEVEAKAAGSVIKEGAAEDDDKEEEEASHLISFRM